MPCFNWKTLPEKGRGALLKDGLKCGVASRGKFACAARFLGHQRTIDHLAA